MTEIEDRLEGVDNYIKGTTRFDEIVVDRITVLAREDKEAITFVAENDTTYPFIRWLNNAGKFLFGMVAHEKKYIDNTDTQKKIENHFSMYRGNIDGSREGFFDAEFDHDKPMLKLENTTVSKLALLKRNRKKSAA